LFSAIFHPQYLAMDPNFEAARFSNSGASVGSLGGLRLLFFFDGFDGF
jgi:hypothetical protein